MMSKDLQKTIEEKMSKVYDSLLEPYDKKVESVIEKLLPMFLSRSIDEIICLGKKMLELNEVKNE